MKNPIRFRRNIGIISSSVGGFMSVVGFGLLINWQIEEVTLKEKIIAYIVVMLLAIPVWFLVIRQNILFVDNLKEIIISFTLSYCEG